MYIYKEVNINSIEELVPVYIETFNSAPWNDDWTMETATKRLHQIISIEDFYGLSIYKNNQLCGVILGNEQQYCNEKLFEIKEFFIKNSIRGKGIGSILFTEFKERLREKDIDKIILLTLNSDDTKKFYEKHGFKIEKDMIFMSEKF